jgi:protein TonB
MFDQFAEERPRGKGEGRRSLASLLVSLVIYGALAAVGVAITATATGVVPREELMQVAFAPRPPPPPAIEEAPPPPPPPPPPRKTKAPRRRVQRESMAAPTELPDLIPEESDAELVEAEHTGPVEGFLDGVEGGNGDEPVEETPPPPPPPPEPERGPRGPIHLPEKATPPQPLESNLRPDYPDEARRRGVQGLVIAKVVVLDDGRVDQIEILRGPEIFHEPVRRALETWRFTPAHFEGYRISVYRIIRVPFRLNNMGGLSLWAPHDRSGGLRWSSTSSTSGPIWAGPSGRWSSS